MVNDLLSKLDAKHIYYEKHYVYCKVTKSLINFSFKK